MRNHKREMLFCLNGHAHRHVWAPCDVSATELKADPDISPEEKGAYYCLHTYGMACSPSAVRDQYTRLVTREVAK